MRWHSPARTRVVRLGEVTLTHVLDGVMSLAPDRFAPEVPRTWWEAHPEQLDADGHLVMPAGGLLVESSGRTLLIDLGWGSFTGSHAFGDLRCGGFLDSLAALGHRPDTIDDVAFTHLHLDHIGWTSLPGTDEPRLTFGNARHWVARAEWLAWQDHTGDHPGGPSKRDHLEPLSGALHLFDDGDEVLPGVRTMPTAGHSPGHTAFVVESAGTRVVAFGDVFHFPAQISNPEWCSLPDSDRDATIHARRQVLAELSRPNTIGFGCHFADVAFGTVVREGETGHRWQPSPLAIVEA
ncbi:MBL fold metallo-hydrolase [Actinophytocola oryzae]|uniref:Glyoxylase-like metal-dependent hydrolase (Beta-lactamase superfamily II) n=1 Tax=Actinophytocola oryzae TaxID=502181 RepID=A0A4R7VH55_9PSEU|nr:MBL fold metallo-hydrolase [Actinophytocola oryzae]TDV48660.1 glyoxylase-like metal-dependent hydrolase (beta-lactamase superfamily II) [Actinophytocola oryzae]